DKLVTGVQTCALPIWNFRNSMSFPSARAYTTVMSWKTDVTLPTLGGVTYGGKDIEFLKFLDLPARIGVPLEVALSGVAPRADLRSEERRVGNGWRSWG